MKERGMIFSAPMVQALQADRKTQTRRRVNYLVEQKLIPHPDDVPCMDCGDEVYTGNYRHKYDHARGYEGENQLYVEAVCTRCHRNREDARRG